MIRTPSRPLPRPLLAALLASSALLPAPALAQSLPTDGRVVRGEASIRTTTPEAMTIRQTSDRAVIDWSSFSVAKGARVDIRQNDARSALLNRVTGDTTSTIAGQITANGQVFLVNPNGILITPTGSVKAAGFVASTLDLSNDAFMAGDITVTGRGGRVTNAGTIDIVKGGYAALIGGRVENSGTILAPLGRVAIGSAARATLDLEGDGFLQVALPASGTDAGVYLPGRIVAQGGAVLLAAGAAREAARGVVHMTGSIDARGVSGRSGSVTLTGGEITLAGASIDISGPKGGGSVRIGGDWQGGGTLPRATRLTVDAATTIRADATGTGNGGRVVLWSDEATRFAGTITSRGAGGGAGGDAEVSGKAWLDYRGHVDLTGARFGTLLLDPYNVTISDAADRDSAGFTATGNDSIINVATLQTALATANVTVSTGTGGSQAGNITVAAPLTWSATTRLTLNAAGVIAVNAPVTVDGGGQVTLIYNPASDTVTGGFSFGRGAGLTFAGTAATETGRLTINDDAFTLVRGMDGLDAIDRGLSGRYALAGDITNAGRRQRTVIGTAGNFTGTLEGLGHTIADLVLTGTGDSAGLVSVNWGTVRNIGLLGGSVSGSQHVGSLIGINYGTVSNAYAAGVVGDGSRRVGGLVGWNSGTVSNAYATGVVNGALGVGGLVGVNVGTVSNAYATGVVRGTSSAVGGLVGSNSGGLSNVYATGAVSGAGDAAGGLVGDASGGTVSNAYATGAVTGRDYVGGLVGHTDGMVTNAYATGAVSGRDHIGGLVGYNYGRTVSNAYATGAVSGNNGVGGLVGYNFRGKVSNGYATGAVSGRTGVGGLVGWNDLGTVDNVYATGAVRGVVHSIGGLVGFSNGSLYNAYWDTDTTGQATSSGGGTGLTTLQLQSGSANNLGAAFAGGSNGLYPYLTSFFPDGVQAVSGIATGANGSPLASGAGGARYVFASAGGSGLSRVTTGANGYYYHLLPAGTLTTGGTSVLAWTTMDGLATGPALGVTLGWLTGTTGGFDVAGDGYRFTTALGTYSAVEAARDAALGGLPATRPAGLDGLAGSIVATGQGGFTFDRAASFGAGYALRTTVGGITVAAPLTLAGGTLTLASAGSLTVKSGIEVTGGTVALSYAPASDPVTGGFSFARGAGLTFAGTAATETGRLSINGGAFTLVRGMDGLNAINGDLSGRYALAGDIANAGSRVRTVIGTSGDFTGTFEGLGHTIADFVLTGSSGNAGLVSVNKGTVRNIGLIGGSVSGGTGVGGLVGRNTGKVSNAFTTGAVTGITYVGGLVGLNYGTVSNVYATGAVSGSGDYVGGLVGYNQGAVSNAYATGAVSGYGLIGGLVGYNVSNQSAVGTVNNAYATGAVSGFVGVGGLVGYNIYGRVSNAYATGAVSGNQQVGGLVGSNSGTVSHAYATGVVSGDQQVGGLVGLSSGGTVSNSYWDKDTTGQATSADGRGLTTAELQSGSANNLGAAFAGGSNGLYPYLTSFFPDGVQAVSGIATGANGSPLASGAGGARYVFASAGGSGLSRVTTGANGYYYHLLPAGTLAAGGTSVLAWTTTDGLATGSALGVTLGWLTGTAGGFDVAGGGYRFTTALGTYSAVEGARDAALAGLPALRPAGIDGLAGSIVATGQGGFTFDRAASFGAGYALRTTVGGITVAAPLTLAGGTLTLASAGSLTVNAGIDVTGDTVALSYAPASDPVTGGFSFGRGAGLTFVGMAVTETGRLSINGDAFTLVRGMDGLNAINGDLSGRYALAGDIANAGSRVRTVIGTSGDFTGTFEGLGHTIANLVLTNGGDNAGLVSANRGTVRNIALIDGSVSGANGVGGLVGYNYRNGTVRNVYATGTVGGSDWVGGLVGLNNGRVSNVFATGAVTGTRYAVGGLAGVNALAGTVSDAYATGPVSGPYAGGLVGVNFAGGTVRDAYATGAVSGSAYVGGLVGANSGTVTNAYATGAVSGSDSSVGGLVGWNDTFGRVIHGYWDKDTTGRATSAGDGTGLTTARFQSGEASGLGTAFAGGSNGLYPYLKSFFPGGVQAVSGTATSLSTAGGRVTLYRDGRVLGSASVGMNGYYYAAVDAGTLAGGVALGQTITARGAAVAGGMAYADGLALDGDGNLSGLGVTSGLHGFATDAANWSTLTGRARAAFGTGAYAALDTALAGTRLEVRARGGFTIDRALANEGADVRIDTVGDLTIANGASLSGRNLTLYAGGNFLNDGGASALSATGRWLVWSGTPAGDRTGGLTPGFVQYAATAATAPAQATGNGFLYRFAPTITIGLTGAVTRVYDGTDVATPGDGNFTLSGQQPGDRIAFTRGGATFATRNAGSGVQVTATGLALGDAFTAGGARVHGYRLASSQASAAIGTITPATLTYAADRASRRFGFDNPVLGGSVTGFVGGDTLGNATTGTLTWTTAAQPGSDVGDYAIAGGGLSDTNGNYRFEQAAENRIALSVTPRALTIAADAASRKYGYANPALTYLLGGDGLYGSDALAGALATDAVEGSNVGRYGIGQGSLSAGGNYAIAFTGADLTVTPRALTIAAEAASRKYGYANPALTYLLGGDGLYGSDALAGALATNAVEGSGVGRYAIGRGSLTAAGNYAITFTGAELTVIPRALTIAAMGGSRIYGDANPALAYTLAGDGLYGSDLLSGKLATSAGDRSGIGRYTIGQGSLTAGVNYRIVYTGADLVVTPRAITVTADPLFRFYGQPNPPLTWTIGGMGLAGGDRLRGALETGADPGSVPGRYVILRGSLGASPDYAITYVPGTLTVGYAPTMPAQSASAIKRDWWMSWTLPDAGVALPTVGTGTVLPVMRRDAIRLP